MRISILTTLITGILFVSSAFADDCPRQLQEKPRQLQEKISSFVMQMEGVNGIGITGCDPETYEQSVEPGFIYCISIMTETEEAAEALSLLFPNGTRVEDVLITILHIGPVTTNPRISAGNGN